MVLVHVGDVEHGLHREQVQIVEGLLLFGVQAQGARAMAFVQALEHLLRHFQLLGARLVALGFLLQARDGLFQRGQVGQDELGLDGLHVGERVHAAGHVHHVRIPEEAHHLADGVRLADVREELVAQALALAGAGDQAGDVHELHRCRHDARRVVDGGQGVQPRVGHGDHAHVGLDGGERVVGREAALVREGREQRGLADVGQPDDTDGQRHGTSFACTLLRIRPIIANKPARLWQNGDAPRAHRHRTRRMQ